MNFRPGPSGPGSAPAGARLGLMEVDDARESPRSPAIPAASLMAAALGAAAFAAVAIGALAIGRLAVGRLTIRRRASCAGGGRSDRAQIARPRRRHAIPWRRRRGWGNPRSRRRVSSTGSIARSRAGDRSTKPKRGPSMSTEPCCRRPQVLASLAPRFPALASDHNGQEHSYGDPVQTWCHINQTATAGTKGCAVRPRKPPPGFVASPAPKPRPARKLGHVASNR